MSTYGVSVVTDSFIEFVFLLLARIVLTPVFLIAGLIGEVVEIGESLAGGGARN